MGDLDRGLPLSNVPASRRRKLVRKSVRLARAHAEHEREAKEQEHYETADKRAFDGPDEQQLSKEHKGEEVTAQELEGDIPSPNVCTARAVHISRNVDTVKTVHFGSEVRSLPQPPQTRMSAQSESDLDDSEHKDITRFKNEPDQSFRTPTRTLFHRSTSTTNGHKRKPTPYPGLGSSFMVPIRQGSAPSVHMRETGPRFLHPALNLNDHNQRPESVSPKQESNGAPPIAPGSPPVRIEDMKEVHELELESLYGTRTLVRVSTTAFQDRAYTPTPRLDNWLDDVEDHTEIRRAEITTENAAVRDMLKRRRDSAVVTEALLREAPSPQANAKHRRSEDDTSSMATEQPMKRARPASIIAGLKRTLSGRRRKPSTSKVTALQRLGDMRHSLMGTLDHGARAISPAFGLSLDLQRPLPRVESFRFAFVRDTKAGKTSLIERFLNGHFSQNATRTLSFAIRNADLEMSEGYRADIELWDIAGSLHGVQAHPLAMTYFHAVFICYGVESDKHVASVIDTWQHVVHGTCDDAPVFVLGLKKDMRPTAPTLKLRFLNEPNPASRSQGEFAGRQIGAVAFMELSAKTGEGVDELFEHVVRYAMNVRQTQGEERKDRLRRAKVRHAVSEAGRTAAQLLCFQDNL